METDRFGTVSIWLGNFKCLRDLEEYVSIKYTEDGDSIDSQFEKDFSNDCIDEDFLEINYLDDSINEFSKIIEGHSYFNSIISNYSKQNIDKLDTIYNSSILAYDLNYDGDINKAKNGDGSQVFIGNFEYDKRDY